MDNRRLSPSQLSVLRRKVVDAIVVQGLTLDAAAQVFGLSKVSLKKYIREYKAYGSESFSYKVRGRSRHYGCKLTLEQQDVICNDILTHTPDNLGLECVLWTRSSVCEHIERKFGVKYALRSMSDLLRSWGFSPQKPIKRALQRDPHKVQHWLEVDYPSIKQRANKEGADIFWGDEMGFKSTDHRGRSYGKIGQKPVIFKNGSRFSCNMIAAINNYGSMKWMVFSENFTADKLIEFLRRLIYKARRKIFLILDNHKAHHSKKVREWLDKFQAKIEIFYLPPYCPEMNPQELVNQDVKANAGNFRVMRTAEDMLINLRYYLTKVQFNESKIQNFFKKKETMYAA